MTDRIVKSSDTEREERLPPGQTESKKLPVLHYGPVPDYSEEPWDLSITGIVEHEDTLSLEDLQKFPHTKVLTDIHCVTGWSTLNQEWVGVLTRDLMRKFTPAPGGNHIMVYGEYGYSANFKFGDFLGEDCLLAWERNGEELDPKHGGPVRLVIPKLYFWKSVKWVRRIEVLWSEEPGFWERQGYHMQGDPWKEQRHQK